MANIKHLSLAALIFGFSSFSSAADLRHTFTAGYAQSHVNFMDVDIDDPKGFNAKYRLDFTNELGVITSYTKTSYDDSASQGGIDAKVSLDYQSFMIGPSFRPYDPYTPLSGYLLIGVAEGKASGYVSSIGSASESKTAFAFGGGLQLNVTDNFVIDASYEYSEIDDVKVGTWVVGGGFSF